MDTTVLTGKRWVVFRWLRKAVTVMTTAVLVSSIGAVVAAAAPAHAPIMRSPAGGMQDLWVPSSMGPIKVQVQWAARGGSAALYLLDGLRAPNDHSQ